MQSCQPSNHILEDNHDLLRDNNFFNWGHNFHVHISEFHQHYNHINREIIRVTALLLKLVFNVSSEYQGCHSDDISVSVYNYKKDFQDHFNIIHLWFISMFMLIKSGNKMWNWWQGLDAIKVQNWHLKSCDDKPENIHTIHLWSPWKPEHVIHNNGAQKSQR